MLRLLRWRWALWRFLLGFRLIGGALKNKDFERELGRMLKYQGIVGTLDGFIADPLPHDMMGKEGR